MSSPEDLLAKLRDEQADSRRDRASARHAMNAAFTAWHMSDWVWGSRIKSSTTFSPSPPVRSIDDFRRHVVAACPELGAMQAIANGSKHLQHGGPAVATTPGSFSNAFSSGFDVGPRLTITEPDGTEHRFQDVLGTAVDYWDKFLIDNPPT